MVKDTMTVARQLFRSLDVDSKLTAAITPVQLGIVVCERAVRVFYGHRAANKPRRRFYYYVTRVSYPGDFYDAAMTGKFTTRPAARVKSLEKRSKESRERIVLITCRD